MFGYGYQSPVIPDRDPTPVSAPMPKATVPVGKLPSHDVLRIRQAANRARKLYPGPVGEFLQAELNAYADYGAAWDNNCRANRMAVELARTPLPGEDDPPGSASPASSPGVVTGPLHSPSPPLATG